MASPYALRAPSRVRHALTCDASYESELLAKLRWNLICIVKAEDKLHVHLLFVDRPTIASDISNATRSMRFRE